MSKFNPSPKTLVVNELIERGYTIDYDDALRICHELEEEQQIHHKAAIGLTTVGIIGAGTTLVFCGVVAPLLASIAAIGVGAMGVWNHPIRAARRDDEADFLRANPSIVSLIEAKLQSGEAPFKVAAAYLECFRAWRNTGQPLALPSVGNVPTDESLPSAAIATSSPIGNQTRLNAVEANVSSDGNSPALFNPAIDLGQNPQSALIAGVPGSGKGILVSNAVRVLRQNHQALKVMMIDPKGDPKEKGYWAPVTDVYRSMNLMDCDDPDEGASWLLACMDEFRKLPAPKLLIFDEMLAASVEISLAHKDFKAPQRMKKFVSGIIAQGDSQAVWLWAMSQSVQVADLGISGGVRGNLRVIGIISPKNTTAIEALTSTRLIPPPTGGMDELREIMKASPVDRAFYDGKLSRWLPMPELENYSGFDRDNRTIEADPTVSKNQAATYQENPAETPNQNDESDDDAPEIGLNHPSVEEVKAQEKELFELGRAILELLQKNPDKSYGDEAIRTNRFIETATGKRPSLTTVRASISAVSKLHYVSVDNEGRLQWNQPS